VPDTAVIDVGGFVMDGTGFGWLEVAPVVIAAVLVFRHRRSARRATDAGRD
jgi:hypothetical protein